MSCLRAASGATLTTINMMMLVISFMNPTNMIMMEMDWPMNRIPIPMNTMSTEISYMKVHLQIGMVMAL